MRMLRVVIVILLLLLLIAITYTSTIGSLAHAQESTHIPTIVNLIGPDEAYVHCAAPSVAKPTQVAPELVVVRCSLPANYQPPAVTPQPTATPIKQTTTEGPATNSKPNECRRDRHNNCKD